MSEDTDDIESKNMNTCVQVFLVFVQSRKPFWIMKQGLSNKNTSRRTNIRSVFDFDISQFLAVLSNNLKMKLRAVVLYL